MSFLILLTFMVCPDLSFADSHNSKDWIWNTDSDNFFYAGTLNTANHFFGQYCYFGTEECYYLINQEVICDEGEEYPGLINSSAEAISVTLTCSHQAGKRGIYIVSPFDAVDKVVQSSNYITIVTPLENDQFKVSRFSLSGSRYAIERMLEASQIKVGSKLPLKQHAMQYL